MSGKFRISVTPVIEFENGYHVFFEPGTSTAFSIFCHIWYDGNKVSLEQFSNNSMNGYFSAEEFAKLLFRVSKANKPPGEKEITDEE